MEFGSGNELMSLITFNDKMIDRMNLGIASMNDWQDEFRN